MLKMTRVRLALMMFLEYFIWGAWYVTVGTWLSRTLHFTGEQVAFTAGTTAIGAILSPFLVGWIADRYFATQKVLACLHGLGAVLLFFASSQTAFGPVYLLVLLYAMSYMPTLALTNSLAFRQMRDPKLEFGAIRVLGSAGWIVAGLLVGGLGIESSAAPLRIAASASLLMAIYCLTLPHTPPLGAAARGEAKLSAPQVAMTLLRERPFLIFVAASFLICVPLQFYYAFTNLFLNEAGVVNAAGKMTGGQFSELACMVMIPWFFRRLGVKYMLGAGMLAWAVRYLLFAYGNAGAGLWLLYAGILMHGICYDFFFVTGQIYVDRKAPPAMRAAAQGMITLITYGAGMLLGSWLSGRVVDMYARTNAAGVLTHDWRHIWLVAGGCSAVVLVLFLLTFFEKEPADERPVGAALDTPVSAVPS